MNKEKKAHLRLVITTLALMVLGANLLFVKVPTILAASNEKERSSTDRIASTSSYAWVTTYDGFGGYDDIAFVASGLADPFENYGTTLSDYVGYVVDNAVEAYVLNWRPRNLGHDLQLCGLRVAYRLPDGSGGFESFSYIHVAGSALRPRDSSSEWTYSGSGGCLYATAGSSDIVYNVHLNIPDGSRIDYLRIYYFVEMDNLSLPLIMR